MSFKDFKLSQQIIDAVIKKGYTIPSPIQIKSIPKILSGRDLMAAAQTGTGKTAAFVLPILEKLSQTKKKPMPGNQVRCLILTPTRELAAQVEESVQVYSQNLDLKSTVVFGGVKINPQMLKLRGGVDILVATPGRLIDLYGQNAVKFSALEVLVLDEADRMLDMGFIADIRRIISFLPEKRQTLLFSATFSEEIKLLAKGLLKSPSEVQVEPEQTSAVTVKQKIYTVDKKQKPEILTHLLHKNKWKQVLVFSKTKHGANRLTAYLQDLGYKALPIHGNKSQAARTKALTQFKSGEIDILVATDIAARGLDIKELPQVVNFDLPQVAEDYVHRIGRTGRAGRAGEAFSLVSADEVDMLFAIEKLLKKKLTRDTVDGFEPQHDVPLVPSKKSAAKTSSKFSKDANRTKNNRYSRK
jgi:ATP-dependent RNA helicase RhlE